MNILRMNSYNKMQIRGINLKKYLERSNKAYFLYGNITSYNTTIFILGNLWYDIKEQRGGTAIEFIQKIFQINENEAIEYISEYINEYGADTSLADYGKENLENELLHFIGEVA